MSRRLYAPGSGVIIDICKDHGLWFDAAELHQILGWITQGGSPKDPLETIKEHRRIDKPPIVVLEEEEDDRDFLDVVLAGVLSSVSGWFRR
jgi:hypothetical protein